MQKFILIYMQLIDRGTFRNDDYFYIATIGFQIWICPEVV